MKDKILDILEKHYYGRNHIESRCADELLDLFNVGVRSEQLAVLVEWLRDNYSIDIPDRVVDEYKRYNG